MNGAVSCHPFIVVHHLEVSHEDLVMTGGGDRAEIPGNPIGIGFNFGVETILSCLSYSQEHSDHIFLNRWNS